MKDLKENKVKGKKTQQKREQNLNEIKIVVKQSWPKQRIKPDIAAMHGPHSLIWFSD